LIPSANLLTSSSEPLTVSVVDTQLGIVTP
jgi:hypothetical protein